MGMQLLKRCDKRKILYCVQNDSKHYSVIQSAAKDLGEE